MEQEKPARKVKIIRVIFRTFGDKIFDSKRYSFFTSLNVWLAKKLTVPLGYKGFKYDHVELLTTKRQRFSIRLEKIKSDPYGLNKKKPVGVYCLNRNGFGQDYEDEVKERKYKLLFAFEINKNQEKKLYQFIKKHKSEQYNLKNTNVNVIINKLKGISCGTLENFLIDDYNDSTKSKKSWDCVTLIMRALHEIDIIPDFRKSGKKINLLGLSSFDMAQLFLDMHREKEFPQIAYVISSELQNEKEYKKGIDNFYRIGAKITRPSKKKF